MFQLRLPGYRRKKKDERLGRDNPYNSRVLVDNWFEERRQYHQDCPRSTGPSITTTDYRPYCKEEYRSCKVIPPSKYAHQVAAAGEGFKFLMNTEDYCDYLRNYTTTNDLMYNWEVRRAGCKPKPWRKWELAGDALWHPQPDNALSYGNLTQIGFRQAPRLPMVPNDWNTYRMDTTYKDSFVQPRHPDDYVLCRYAPSKCIRREIEDMTLVPRPGTTECDRYWALKNPKDNDACVFPDGCHKYVGNLPRVHPTLVPFHTINPRPPEPAQNLFPNSRKIYQSLKHPPHPCPVPGEPILESITPGRCENKELCEIAKNATIAAQIADFRDSL